MSLWRGVRRTLPFAGVALIGWALVGLLTALPASPGNGNGQGNGSGGSDLYAPYVQGEVLIKFENFATLEDREGIRSRLASQTKRRFRSGAEQLQLGEGLDVPHAIALMRGNPNVKYVEPNYIVNLETVPNDVRYPELWGLNNTGQTGGTPGSDIDAERAWNVSTGSSSVMVAVIDTGIDYNHPDLAANVWTNPGEIPGNGIDDDGNGYIDDIHGWDFYNDDNDPFDDNSHGSHCSGTIGAIGDNTIGVAGVNWDVTIVALKFLSAAGSGSTADAVAAVDYATALGVDVMSNSWGGGGFSQTLLDAIDAAAAADIVFVAAAGNSSSDNDVTPHYPSSYSSPNIIAVMATDANDVRSYWTTCACSSNVGLTSVDIAAPGTDILSTIPGGGYGLKSGTSMATPHVAGAAALLRAVAPGLPAVQVRQVLMDLSDPVPGLATQNASGGRLNAFFPIAEPDDTAPGMIDDLATTSATSNSMFLSWTATGDDGDVGTASTYDLRYSTAPIDDMNFAMAMKASGTPDPGPSGTPQSTEVLGLVPGTLYYFAIKAKDEWGNDGPISNLASGTTLPAPTIATSTVPDPMEFNLLTGQSATGTLYIDNAGVGTLDWTIPLPTVSGPTTIQQEPLELAKGEPDPRVGDPVVDGFGGPDMFGYRWIDSDDPGGPTFTWNDISMTGTPITALNGDDQNSGPIPLGFDFSFYGNTFDSVRVSTNGWMSFTSSATTYNNQNLPTTSGPENMIAGFWDDLHFRSANRAVYASDGSSFIVQFTDVDRYSTGSNLTFQMEVRSSGEIYLRYLSLAGVTNDCTVGIQNATQDDGLTVAFNTDYLHDDLEIRIAAVPQWMTAAPTSGRLYGPDPAAEVTVTVDATGLDGGTYEGFVYVQSNDPLNPTVEHPVTLYVTGAPAIQVVPLALDFGHVYVGFPETLTLQINNTGTDTLTVSSIVPGDPTVTVTPSSLTIPAHSGQTVDVTYTPVGSGGTLGSTLAITSDASNASTVNVSLSGTSELPPNMLVTPTSFSETLYTGGTVNRNLRISNTGASDLNVTLSADLGSLDTSEPPPTTTELDKGDESDNGTGDYVIEREGGPDAAGYRYIDSDAPGGPTFDWIDISGIGTPVPGLDGDDQNSGPVPIGFDFTFYGNTFNTVNCSSNGWLSFTSTISSGTYGRSNQHLPVGNALYPENLLAVWWNDLHLQGVDKVRYYNDGSRFIVQYTDARTYYNTGSLTFQVILYPSGKIVYQYLSMTGTLNSSTIGIQNATSDIGLEVSYNEDYVHDGLAIEFSRVPDWLDVNPKAATILPGSFGDFTVAFNAGDSGDNVFHGFVDIVSLEPPIELHVPATLTVLGVADVATDPVAVDFGTRFVGYPYIEDLYVQNVGTGVLTVTDVTSNNPNLLVLEPLSTGGVFVIPPGGSVRYELRWLAPSPGPLNATVTVYSDDPDEPMLAVPVTGTAIIPPVFGYTPSSFTSNLFVGETDPRTLTITNTGGSDLEFDIGVRLTDATVTVHDEMKLGKYEDDPRAGMLGTGGPDMFGYRWKDSDEVGGPAFDWVDISGVGTPVWTIGTTVDDGNSGPIPIGFDFPFYGDTFSEVRVVTNGWLSFTSSLTSYSNQPLPNSGAPENLLAVFWDDLYHRSGTGSEPYPTAVYTYNDGSRFIVQYQHIYRLGSTTDDLNFEVILYPSGKIVFQYDTMSTSTINSHTIGIQNAAKDDGLQVVYNDGSYIHDNLAIVFQAAPDWLTASPLTGVVPPGGSIPINVVFNATELIGGVYNGGLTLNTNDPSRPRADVPATLYVTGFPAISAAPASLDFGTVFVGVTADLEVVISNPGTDVLNVTNVMVNGEYSTDTTPFSLAVGESRTLNVTFAPVDDGTRPGSIVLTSNATGMPELTVPLTGDGLWPPIAGVDPSSVETALPPGGSKTKEVELCNTGGSDLIWTAGTSTTTDGTSVTVYESLDLGKEDVDPRPGILGTGGPDLFGYTWKDSDEPGGPVFDWVDISGVGTQVQIGTTGYGDDTNAGPFPIGFNFPFYGNMFNEFRVVTNGWLSFTSSLTTYSNQPLPNSGSSTPENLLAVFWDDLVHRNGTGSEPAPSAIYYYNDGTRFIVQYQHIYRIANYTDDLNFQVILYPNGKIVFQYETMSSGTLNSATIGIQNATKDDGLTVVYNDNYVHDNMAIELKAAPAWLGVSPESGVLPAGECTPLTVNLNAAELAEGDYEGLLTVLSNDPFNGQIDVPILLHVAVVDLDWIDVEPNTLNLSSNGNTVKAILQLPAMYDPWDIVIETVSIYGQLFANPHPIAYEDNNHDGVMELVVKFDRGAFEALVPEGDNVPVTITGEVRDTVWFTGTDYIRTIRPTVTHPNGAEYLVAGQMATISWIEPPLPADSYTLWLSRDGGQTWDELASGVTDTTYGWTVAGAPTEQALVRVFALDNRGVMGYDTSDASFVIAGTLYPPRPVNDLTVTLIEGSDVILGWKLVVPDLEHGPADFYRILRATSAAGPFTEIGTSNTDSFTDEAANHTGADLHFFSVVPVNSAGEGSE